MDKCKVKTCERDIFNKKHKLCNAHYQRWRLKGDLERKKPIVPHRVLPIAR